MTDILASIYYCIWADVVVGLTELRKKYLAVKKKKKKKYLRGKYKQY